MLCLYTSSLQRRRILQEMSSGYCLPGRAGGFPLDVSVVHVLRCLAAGENEF